MRYPVKTQTLDSIIPGRIFRQEERKKTLSNNQKILIFILAGAVLMVGIVLVKSKTATEFWSSPLLYFYTIFVTTFQLSRLGAAMLYKKAREEAIDVPAKADYEPTVTIIIPCKNEEKLITETVGKCLEADYPEDKLDVIVVNDGSTDRTGERLHNFRAKLPVEERGRLRIIDFETNRGKREAMAEAFRNASGEIVVQMDSDSYIDPKTFRNVITPFANPEIGGVSVHTEPSNPDKNILTKAQAAYYFMSFRIMKAAESIFYTVLCLSGSASAYRKNIVLPILDEWANEKFRGKPVTWGDDRALTSWLIREGHKTIYINSTKAWTEVPETFSQLLRQQLRWKKSWIINALFTSRFIFKTRPFFAVSYYLPLIIISMLTPIVITYSVFYTPLVKDTAPIYYFLGISLVTTLVMLYYRFVAPGNRYWPYLYVWGILNAVFLSFLIVVAAIKLGDRGWGTR